MKRSTVDSLQNPANITSHAHVFITPFAPLLSLFSNTILLLFVCLHFSFHDKFSVFFLLWLPQQLLFRQTRVRCSDFFSLHLYYFSKLAQHTCLVFAPLWIISLVNASQTSPSHAWRAHLEPALRLTW